MKVNPSQEDRIRERYIKLGGLIQGGQMINKDKEDRARQYVINRGKIIERMVAAYDPREHKGPSAYTEMADVEKWVRRDLDKGHFIEAYALTDQYIDTIIQVCFPEVFIDTYKKTSNKVAIETVLRCASGLKMVDKKIVDKYRDFKSTRDDFVHKSIFNQNKARQLKNQSKIKKLPFQIIKEAERLLNKRCLEVYMFFLKYRPDGTKKYDGSLFGDFVMMWARVWQKQGKNLSEFFNDIKNLKQGEIKSVK